MRVEDDSVEELDKTVDAAKDGNDVPNPVTADGPAEPAAKPAPDTAAKRREQERQNKNRENAKTEAANETRGDPKTEPSRTDKGRTMRSDDASISDNTEPEKTVDPVSSLGTRLGVGSRKGLSAKNLKELDDFMSDEKRPGDQKATVLALRSLENAIRDQTTVLLAMASRLYGE